MISYRAMLAALLATAAPPLAAYELAGYQWADSATSFQAGRLQGTSPSGVPWQSAFSSAASQWTTKSSFNYSVLSASGDPCEVPTGTGDVNAVMFADSKCGTAFGASTLAVTRNWSVGDELIQAGIIFNDADVNWDVYSGSWGGTSNADFRRVAVHELGHAMGLAHAPGGIMSAYAGSTETPQSDDLAGVAALYGGSTDTSTDDGSDSGGTDGSGGGSGGTDDSGDDTGGTGTTGTGGTGGSTGTGGTGGSTGTGGTGGSQPRPDRIFAGGFEADDVARGKSVLAATDGSLVAYEPRTRRIFVHDPASGARRAVTVAGSGRVSLVEGDFDGDGLTDVGTFRALDGLWTIYPGSGKPFWRYRLGGPGDVAVPADFDGDGRTDLAVWSPATGEWTVKLASAGDPLGFKLGDAESDVPVPADYNGDGRVDPAVWSPSRGEWRILNLSTGTGRAYHLPAEEAGRLKVAPGDYDGDGRADPALFDAGTGTWTVRASRWAENRIRQFPSAGGGKAAPADYDGDGRTDLAWLAKGELTMALSGSGEQVTRSLRGVIPLSTRPAPVETDRSAAAERRR